MGGFLSRTAASLFLLVMVFAPLGARAQMTHNFIGLSPSSVEATDLLRDRVVEKTVNLQRDLAELPLTLQATFNGPDARFIQGPEFVEFEVGQLSTTYTFQILPDAAATGAYSATIDFLPVSAADAPTGTGFGIRRGVTLKVGFTVTDKEVIGFSVLHTEMRPTEVGMPFYFTYTVDNTGNVEWRPDEVAFSFKDIFTDQIVDEIILDGENLDFAKPGNMSAIQTEVDHNLAPNNYAVEVKFYDQGEVVHLSTGTLVVFESGTLAQEAAIDGVTTNKLVYRPGENIKVTGRLQNTGHLAVTGVMITEIYSEVDELVDILTSDPREVAPGEVGEVDQIVKLIDAGEYRVESHFEYASSKATDTASTVIQVEGVSLASGLNILPFILLGLAALILILVLIYLYIRSKRRRSPKVVMPPQSAQPLAQGAPKEPVPDAPAMVKAMPPSTPLPPEPKMSPMPEKAVEQSKKETTDEPSKTPPKDQEPPSVPRPPEPVKSNPSKEAPPVPTTPPEPPAPVPVPVVPAKPTQPPALPKPEATPAPAEPPEKKDIYIPPKEAPKMEDDGDDMWTISL